MFALTSVVCYQHGTFANIEILGLDNLYNDLNYTKAAICFSNRCIANLLRM